MKKELLEILDKLREHQIKTNKMLDVREKFESDTYVKREDFCLRAAANSDMWLEFEHFIFDMENRKLRNQLLNRFYDGCDKEEDTIIVIDDLLELLK